MASGHSKSMDVDDDDMCLVGRGCGSGATLDTSQRDSMSSPSSSILSDSHSSLQSPLLTESPGTMLNPTGVHDGQGSALKPRIWSIVDTATSHNSTNGHQALQSNNHMYNSSSGHLHGMGVPGSGFHFGTNNMNTIGGPAVKVSQQLARNLRLGYTSPYTKAAWLNGAFASMSAQSTSSTTTSALPPSMVVSTAAGYPLSVLSSAVTTLSTNSSSSLSSTQSSQNTNSGSSNLHINSPLAKASAVMATSTAAPSSVHPISLASVHSTPTMSVNSTLFGRTYAQTIQNLTHLTKGLNHLMAPQLNGSFTDLKRSPVPQDQRAELQSSSS